jgi:hypothetical protein
VALVIRRTSTLVLGTALALVLVAGTPLSAARFGTQAAASGTVATRTWFFLHHTPSPPTGNTTAQANLSMTTAPPTASTLYNYDTNLDSLAGRRIRRNGTGVGDTTLARYANWRSPAFSTATTISGTVTLRVWTGVAGFPLNTRGVLVAYLRDYNPATNAYTTIASATLNQADWQGGVAGWVEKRISIPVTSYSLAAGRRLELKIQAPAAAPSDMVIAYDTTTYPSILGLP